MLFRHEFLSEALAYLPYMECYRAGKTRLVTGTPHRTWHNVNMTRTRKLDTTAETDDIFQPYYTVCTMKYPACDAGTVTAARYASDDIDDSDDEILHNEYGPAHIDFFGGATPMHIRKEEYYINGRAHRDDGPAMTEYYASGQLCREIYYWHGEWHRGVDANGISAPAEVKYNIHGQVIYEDYYIHNRLHRENGLLGESQTSAQLPAIIVYFTDSYGNGAIRGTSRETRVSQEEYYINGAVGRADSPSGQPLPAVIEYYSSGQIRRESYYVNSLFHRENGPAIIYYHENGKIKLEEYRMSGKYHRDSDAPTIFEYYDSGQINYVICHANGKMHCKDGPAVVKYDTNGRITYFANYTYGVCTYEHGERRSASGAVPEYY